MKSERRAISLQNELHIHKELLIQRIARILRVTPLELLFRLLQNLMLSLRFVNSNPNTP